MILYKNVDIVDLESILKYGILSLDKSGNNNWDDGKRADNPTDCVYLFKPIERKENTFPNYGVALLEVEVHGAETSKFSQSDVHKDDYIEYTVTEVAPERIIRIIIPDIFRERLNLSESVEKMVEWCGFYAEDYTLDGFVKASDEMLKMFAKTSEIEDSRNFNFLRGVDKKRHMIDLYNIRYEF